MPELDTERGIPRLLFTPDELDDPVMGRYAKKAEKAANAAEKAKKKLPAKKMARPTSSKSASSGGLQSKEHPAKKKAHSQLQFEELQKPPSKMVHPAQCATSIAQHQVLQQVTSSNEDNNVAVEALLKADYATNAAYHIGENAYHAHRLKPYRNALHTDKKLDKANIEYLEQKRWHDQPMQASNPLSRWQQKRAIRKEYAAAKAGRTATNHTTQAGKAAEKATTSAADTVKKSILRIKDKPKAFAFALLAGMLLMVMSGLQACSPLAQSVLQSIVIGTYPADEETVKAAERAYRAKEQELQNEMDFYLLYHPIYDDCVVDADEIWHDPYVLIAIISAYYDGEPWDIDKAMPVIEKYFELQYVRTEEVETETRYRKEPRIGTRVVTDPVTGETHTETYTYLADEPYIYRTMHVRLENKNLSHLPVISMSRHALGLYALYMASHGNMEGIFAGNPHAMPLRDPFIYEIPEDVLDANPTFKRLMDEANRYVGYPYVWGGDSPETSFDCSGFVSWVFTNSGVYNTGRLGATGLYHLCRTVAPSEAEPGDVVFFQGTMGDAVDGITHCGIYVGNGYMLHCGNPIGYADLSDSYWRQHFHSFGRPPY